jgi:hypothetical protein
MDQGMLGSKFNSLDLILSKIKPVQDRVLEPS